MARVRLRSSIISVPIVSESTMKAANFQGSRAFISIFIDVFRSPGSSWKSAEREIGMLLPNNQRQHRILHIQQDVLPCTLR